MYSDFGATLGKMKQISCSVLLPEVAPDFFQCERQNIEKNSEIKLNASESLNKYQNYLEIYKHIVQLDHLLSYKWEKTLV